jgi:predicted ester cyclase
MSVKLNSERRNSMSSEQNKATLMRLIEEGFGRGNMAVVDEVLATNFVEHQNGITPPNAEGVKGAIASLHKALSDLSYAVEDMVADGDKVWVRLKARSVHTGRFMGLPPSGKSVVIDVIDISRFENGKIVEHWGVPDRLGLMEQLGALPRPSESNR